MKKFLSIFMVLLLMLSVSGCNKNKSSKDDPEKGEETAKTLTVKDVKDAAKNAGYVVNDYIACSTGLTEDQMDGFTVEIYTSATTTNSYCVIVAISEDYAKQACDAVSNSYNTCVRNANVISFMEVDASQEVQSMLKSITSGKPIEPVSYPEK